MSFAYSIFENNIKTILIPETEFKPCPETESVLDDFYKELKRITNTNLAESTRIMNEELSKEFYTPDQSIIHIQPEKLQQYVKILTSRNNAYAAAMHGLCRQLERDIEACQKTLESGTYKAANMVRMQKTLNEFLSESNTLLASAVKKHNKLLEQGITAVEKYKSNKSYKVPKRLFTTVLLYEDSFRIILDSISKLEEYFKKMPPIELKTSDNAEICYESFTAELSDTVEFYSELFLSYESKIQTKLNSPDLFYHAFQACIKKHGKTILSALIPVKEIEEILKQHTNMKKSIL